MRVTTDEHDIDVEESDVGGGSGGDAVGRPKLVSGGNGEEWRWRTDDDGRGGGCKMVGEGVGDQERMKKLGEAQAKKAIDGRII